MFDWDGTLVLQWKLMRAALKATFHHMEISPDRSLLRTIFIKGLPVTEGFPLLFGDRWRVARDFFYQELGDHHLDTLQPVKGASTFLQRLHGRCAMSVVSNRASFLLNAEVKHLGWQVFFKKVVGSGDAAEDKPHPSVLLYALEGWYEAGKDVWVIGDSLADVHLALNTGCTAVAFGRKRPGAHIYVRSFRGLWALVVRLL